MSVYILDKLFCFLPHASPSFPQDHRSTLGLLVYLNATRNDILGLDNSLALLLAIREASQYNCLVM